MSEILVTPILEESRKISVSVSSADFTLVEVPPPDVIFFVLLLRGKFTDDSDRTTPE
jgi:hypothetical protein